MAIICTVVTACNPYANKPRYDIIAFSPLQIAERRVVLYGEDYLYGSDYLYDWKGEREPEGIFKMTPGGEAELFIPDVSGFQFRLVGQNLYIRSMYNIYCAYLDSGDIEWLSSYPDENERKGVLNTVGERYWFYSSSDTAVVKRYCVDTDTGDVFHVTDYRQLLLEENQLSIFLSQVEFPPNE
jgi:hypothetical protein